MTTTRRFEFSAVVTVSSTADLDDPIIRNEIFKALVAKLRAAPIDFPSTQGDSTASFRRMTGVSCV